MQKLIEDMIRGKYVVLDIEDYEKDRAEKKLLMKLREAEEAVQEGNGWLSLDDLKIAMENGEAYEKSTEKADRRYDQIT